ncbi:MAG: nuclear transport factor 2 family protein [Acidobacteriota bacterium]
MSQPAITNPDIRSQIEQIENATVAAFNTADLDRMLSYFSEDINGFSSTHNDRYRGLDALRDTFEYYLAKSESIYYQISDLEIQMLANGEAVLATFYWKTAPLVDAQEDIITGRATHIFERRNGRWTIVHEHFSRAH